MKQNFFHKFAIGRQTTFDTFQKKALCLLPTYKLGYSGYVVANHVTFHTAYGVGVYSFFRDHDVHVKTAIRAPIYKPTIQFVHPFTVFLSGKGSIEHVLNDKGSRVYYASRTYFLCL